MAHPIIRDKFINSIRAAVDEARGLGRLNHPGLEGQVREILAGRLIRPYIGPEVGFGTGKIIDSSGNTSNQLDIVLYVANILPQSFPILTMLKLRFWIEEEDSIC